MIIERIEIDSEDEFFLEPRPQHTIEFFTQGLMPVITVGYNDSDDLKIKIGRDVITYTFSSGLSLDLPDIEYWEVQDYISSPKQKKEVAGTLLSDLPQ